MTEIKCPYCEKPLKVVLDYPDTFERVAVGASQVLPVGGAPQTHTPLIQSPSEYSWPHDVSVKIEGKTIFFEVETGDNIHSFGPEHVQEKMEELRKNCYKLIVLVTKREMKGKYELLAGAKTITRTEVPGTVAGLFEGC